MLPVAAGTLPVNGKVDLIGRRYVGEYDGVYFGKDLEVVEQN